jgi:DNA polymerase elongation subunit (family B)
MLQSKPKIVIAKSFRLFYFDILNTKLDTDDSADSDDDGSKKYKQRVDDKQFIVQMYGINEKGETVSILVDDYQPFFYIKVGDEWTDAHAGKMVSAIRREMGDYYKESLVQYSIVDSQKLYGFTAGKQSKFVKLVFSNTIASNKVKNLWYKKMPDGSRRPSPFIPKTQLYESNLPPLLRFFHLNHISPNGWIMISNRARPCALRTTTCTYEFVASQAQIKALPDKEAMVPYKIMSFDIEAGSSHGDFPLPRKTYKRLAMNIMDALDKERVGVKEREITVETIGARLKEMILAAFGYAKVVGVDLVYPKSGVPAKKYVEAIIQEIISNKLSNLEVKTADAAKLLTIDAMFAKAKSQFAPVEVEVEEEEGDDAEGEEGDAKGDNDIDSDDDDLKPIAQSSLKGVNITIANLILSTDVERDKKVQYIDQALTESFPPLEGDPVTMIGSTFVKYGSVEPYLNHCVVLDGCEPIDGAVIEAVPIVGGDRVAAEREVLLRWAALVQRENPDIIIGYNIFGFDYEFLFRRAEETHCVNEFLQLSRRKEEFCGTRDRDDPSIINIENTKIVIASGEYDLHFILMSGRLQVDMYSYFRRNFNLSSYKLDDVASQNISDAIKKVVNIDHPTLGAASELYSKNLTGLHVGDFIHIEISTFTADYYMDGKKFVVLDIYKKDSGDTVIVIGGHHEHTIDKTKKIQWGMAKDDVSPQDIFRMSNGTDAERAIVAKYCIQDCNLVHHLMRKIDVLTEYMEMANLCSVPINFLVFRGQGIKLTSYVAKKCMEKGYIMPDLEKGRMDGGYEGAIVLPPKTKIYIEEPVACVDYSSLYPSSMISQNYCHSSKVWAKEYDLDGRLVKDEGEKDAKGNYIYFGLPQYQYVEVEFDTFEWRRNPARPAAKAVKTKVGKRVVCWAQLPNDEKSVMPSILMELLKARSDTRKKEKMYKESDPFMANIMDKRQQAYKVTANSLYGQCGARTSTFYEKDVAASTTASGRIMITYARRIIEEIYANRLCQTKNHGVVMTNAEYVYGDSVAMYTPIYIRTNGKLLNVIKIADLAELYGTDASWRKCEDQGRQTKEVCELVPGIETWTEKGWTPLKRVIRHILAPHKKIVRIQTPSGWVDVTDDHSLLLKTGEEVSPTNVGLWTELLHHDMDFNTIEYDKTSRYGSAMKYIDEFMEDVDTILVGNYLDAAYVYLFLKERGYYVKQKTTGTRQLTIALTYSKTPFVEPDMIRSIETMPTYHGYVYDLTTENHHFAAGVGSLIVHNTDSVFFVFNLTDKDTGAKIVGKDALEITIELAQHAADYATKYLKPPMNLAYEKTLMPFALLSKKRYVGILYEEDPNKGKLKYMGLSLKRRDSCDYLKDTYGQIINIIMTGGSVKDAITFLDNSLTNLIAGRVPTDKLAITKSLRSYYKNPQQIAHRVLADRIGQRDPGNMPKAGDRMKFLHVVVPNKKALQGEKIETPEFILEKKLKLDFGFYVSNQLMKPLCQFLGLALEEIWKYQDKMSAIKKHRADLAALAAEWPDIEQFAKKKEKYCSDKAKAMLFDKYLVQINNDKAGLRPITSFFK